MHITYYNLIEKPQAKNLLGRTGHGWEDNMKMDLIVRDGASEHDNGAPIPHLGRPTACLNTDLEDL
jgi:hypothetical protein